MTKQKVKVSGPLVKIFPRTLSTEISYRGWLWLGTCGRGGEGGGSCRGGMEEDIHKEILMGHRATVQRHINSSIFAKAINICSKENEAM